MSFQVTLKVSGGAGAALAGAASKDRLMEATRRGASKVGLLIVGNFRDKNRQEPNSFVREGFGSRRTYFWRRMADSVKPAQVDAANGKVTIRMHRLVRHKHKGGTILPVRAKALTIPVHPAAYARRAADVERIEGVRLFVLRTVLGDAFLAGRKELRKGRASVVRYFLLRRSVTQAPWPGTLPARASMRAEFRKGVMEVLNSKKGRR